jgi:hypothetical protein
VERIINATSGEIEVVIKWYVFCTRWNSLLEEFWSGIHFQSGLPGNKLILKFLVSLIYLLFSALMPRATNIKERRIYTI